MKRVKIVASLLQDVIDDAVCASYIDNTIDYDKLIEDLRHIQICIDKKIYDREEN